MKNVFETPILEIITFISDVMTKDPSVGDGDVNVNFVPDREFIKHWLYENQPCVETFWYN